MIGAIVKRIVGTKNERELKGMRPVIARINELEASLQQFGEFLLKARLAKEKAAPY